LWVGGTTLSAEWTIREVLNWTRGYFEAAGIVQPRLEAEILLAHALDVERLNLYLSPDQPLTVDERTRYRTVVKRRREGTPLQHLIGEVRFFGLRFRVSRDALIPRPETEELLDHILKLVPRDRDIACLDLGTGTGVIAVCLARYFPQAAVTAVDVLESTLQLARGNAALNGVEDRIAFIESDWFERVPGTFDLIASNPPYVAEEELKELPVEVREHEPRAALDGGPGGLREIAKLVEDLPVHMNSGGLLFLEIGHGQDVVVSKMLTASGFVDVRMESDLAGKKRYVVARWPS
jgi:release factor glutamine methyltransferase